eukprot:TRINITY_DN5272_c0_g1_i2.p1 TRINITY_DN5272_c0_g1~~TRINITY_DN5272_c0_g1_i2.p1  ORF type:complete len:377 (+),score=79.82 TRINITY_DN5272_c0_g1_i2:65-1195(+)
MAMSPPGALPPAAGGSAARPIPLFSGDRITQLAQARARQIELAAHEVVDKAARLMSPAGASSRPSSSLSPGGALRSPPAGSGLWRGSPSGALPRIGYSGADPGPRVFCTSPVRGAFMRSSPPRGSFAPRSPLSQTWGGPRDTAASEELARLRRELAAAQEEARQAGAEMQRVAEAAALRERDAQRTAQEAEEVRSAARAAEAAARDRATQASAAEQRAAQREAAAAALEAQLRARAAQEPPASSGCASSAAAAPAPRPAAQAAALRLVTDLGGTPHSDHAALVASALQSNAAPPPRPPPDPAAHSDFSSFAARLVAGGGAAPQQTESAADQQIPVHPDFCASAVAELAQISQGAERVRLRSASPDGSLPLHLSLGP